MKVKVCVGSSCHIKGSGEIIQLMKSEISKHKLEDTVTLSAAFCLGRCTDGVSVMVDDEIFCGISPENFIDFFNSHILHIKV